MPLNDVIQSLSQTLSCTKIRTFLIIVRNIFLLTRPVTTKSISGIGGTSHSTISRFYSSWFDWPLLCLTLFKKLAYRPEDVYIAAVDEVIEGKAGKHTYGKSIFFSNILKKPIPAISMLAISLINVKTKQSYPMAVTRIVKNEQDIKRSLKQKEKAKDLQKRKAAGEKPKPKGRSKGVPNSKDPKEEPETLVYRHLKGLLSAFITKSVSLFCKKVATYLVGDGGFGSENYFLLARLFDMHLITKLKCNSVLYLPFVGNQKSKGGKTKYGEKINYNRLDKKYLKSSLINDNVQEDIFQFQVYNKEIANTLLNVVVVVQTRLDNQKTGYAVFASTDLNLDALTLIGYYRLRFEIEIDFRDCKQFNGLADFKNYKQLQVTNAINIAFATKTITQILLSEYRVRLNNPDFSIYDLKAFLNAENKAKFILKMNREKPHLFLNGHTPNEVIMQIAQMDAVNIKMRA